MDYTDVIKRAWQTTWRHKALWVLGIFAGITGCSGGYSGGSASSGSGSNQDFADFSNTLSGVSAERFFDRYLPLIIAGIGILVLIWLISFILSMAARGGLVHAVNEVQDGRPAPLGGAWGRGFALFGRTFGLTVLLRLPLALLTLVVLGVAFVPIMTSLIAGNDPSAGSFAAFCGSLGIGLPVLLIASLFLDVLYIVALRYSVLGDRRVFDSVRAGWQAMMARKGEHFLVWVINGVLNLLASTVMGVIVFMSAAVLVLPLLLAARGEWTTVATVLVVTFTLVILVIGYLYTGIWGTFTSSLWTVFFRKMTGLEPAAVAAAPEPVEPMAPQYMEPPQPFIPPLPPEPDESSEPAPPLG